MYRVTMLVVGSAIVGNWLQFFLIALNLFLYLDREDLRVEQGLAGYHTKFVYRNPEGLVH